MYESKKIKISTVLYVLLSIAIAIELTWLVASYINIIQHNMGSCDYAAWNLITKMF